MKQDKDWIDVMRSSLRDAEPTPPAGGWERLERELGLVKPHTPAWRIYWPRIAAAAAVLLCIVAGELLLHENQGIMTDGNVIEPVADGGGSSADIFLKSEWPELGKPDASMVFGNAQQASTEDVRGGGVRTVSERFGDRAVAAVAVERKDAVPESDDFVDERIAAGVAEPAVGEERPASQGQKTERRVVPGGNLQKVYGNDLFAEAAPRGKRTSLGLFAGGGMIGGTTNGRPGRMLSNVVPPANGDVVMDQRYKYADYSFRHHLPLSFGLAVRKEFSHGLSLESGVNYTLLMSDVGVRNGSKDITQKLHFIGVPVRFNWRFFEYNRFSLYLGAGGMVEKCIAAKFGSRSVDEAKVQWSAFAAAGAQYRLGGVVALYFEPEGAYYFTKTALRTARTDSPLTFSLRLGMRFTF